jgi:hypothetical protein
LTFASPCIIIQFKQINQQDATVSQVCYFKVYVSPNMFRAPPLPSSGAYNCINSLWFLPLVVTALLVVVWLVMPASQTTTNNAATTSAPTVKPEAINAVVSS